MVVVAPAAPAREPGLINRLLIWVSGVDKATLDESPAEDWDCVRSIGLLMIFAWIYQAALITIVAHRVFGSGRRLSARACARGGLHCDADALDRFLCLCPRRLPC